MKTFGLIRVICVAVCIVLTQSCGKEKLLPYTATIERWDYMTGKFGDQVWLLQNLYNDQYQNTNPIGNIVRDPVVWRALNFPNACAVFLQDEETYGGLYNYCAVIDPRKVCPQGYRIPNRADWEKLMKHFGSLKRTYGKKRNPVLSLYGKGWIIEDVDVNENKFKRNLFELTASGYINNDNEFNLKGRGRFAYYWADTGTPVNGTALALKVSDDLNWSFELIDVRNGAACRCIQDED